MQITLTLNGIRVSEEIAPDMLLIDFVRAHGCKSVKRGCETANCGLCTAALPSFNVDICLPLCLLHQDRRIQIGQGAIPLRVEESLQFLFAGPVFPFLRLLHQLEQCLTIILECLQNDGVCQFCITFGILNISHRRAPCRSCEPH